MSRSVESQSEGDEQGGQPLLTDFIKRACSVCGRTYDENEVPCHSERAVVFERRLATQDWLLSDLRLPNTPAGQQPVIGNDCVSFEVFYLGLRSIIDTESTRFDEYVSETPYEISEQKWIASVFRQHLSEQNELILGVLAGIRASEDRITQKHAEVTPARVFAHVVFLDQYGLLPGYRALRRGSRKSLRDICAEYHGVQPDALDSQWVVRRRVDRSKVYSTTPEFRQVWDIEFSDRASEHTSHPHSDCRPFDGTAIIGDHRDHNLIARRAKEDLLRLPNVDWTIAPHIFYSRSDSDSSDSSTSKLPILGFDVAGFEYAIDGQRLRYLGVITDWEESLFETYLQAVQLGKTAATGVVILPNRERIYDFLHFLKSKELTRVQHVFPESRDEYRSIPNVQALHDQLIREIPLLDDMALIPRRKFLDEGFETIADLISVPTYA